MKTSKFPSHCLVVLALAVVLSACNFPKTVKKKTIPRGFQNIKLGLTLTQVKMMIPCEQRDKTHLQIETPNDTIKLIDCIFGPNGEHLYKMVLHHFVHEETTVDQFLAKPIKRFGQPNERKRVRINKNDENDTFVATWIGKDHSYTIRGMPSAGRKLYVEEEIIDTKYLNDRRIEAERDEIRANRRIIEHGKY